MALASLRFWADLSRRAALPVLHRIGVLELIGRDDGYARESREAIRRAGGRVEDLSRDELAKRYPQISLEGITAGQLEPASGAVMARRAVLTLVKEMVAAGATYLMGAVAPPAGKGRLSEVRLRDGRALQAGTFVFACGPWLPRLFPEVQNVWLVGGGSGHGFKHGPAVGDYAARALLGSLGSPEPRFSLATKQVQQQRAVY